MEIEPDICISYSGANDLYHDYASYYEYDFFSSNVSKSKSSVLLPNTLFVIKKWLGIRSVNMMEEKEDTVDIKFWNRNMAMLNNLAVGRNAKFIGVLQPVLGVGKHKQDREMDIYAGNIAGYKTYYPALMERCIQHPNYLYDMSMVFDSINDKVFMDDCHLTNTFQPFIAKRIVHLLQEKGILR
jgi:hypothetical protein